MEEGDREEGDMKGDIKCIIMYRPERRSMAL